MVVVVVVVVLCFLLPLGRFAVESANSNCRKWISLHLHKNVLTGPLCQRGYYNSV